MTQGEFDGHYAIFIYCDHPSHPEKPQSPVLTFFYAPDEPGPQHVRWAALLPPTRRPGGVGISKSLPLKGDRRPAPNDTVEDPETGLLQDGSDRTRHWLICRKCKDRPVPARAEKLDRVLDGIKDAGLHAVPLRVVAASLARLR